MANYDSLINAVKAAVKTNGTGAITGATLQATLLGTIEELTVGFQFMGVATPETTPDSNDKKEFYIGFAGTYANFGNSVTVPEGSVILFKKNNGAWSSQVVKIADPVSVLQNSQTGKTELLIGDTPALIVDNEPEVNSDNIVKSGGVFDVVGDLDKDKTSYDDAEIYKTGYWIGATFVNSDNYKTITVPVEPQKLLVVFAYIWGTTASIMTKVSENGTYMSVIEKSKGMLTTYLFANITDEIQYVDVSFDTREQHRITTGYTVSSILNTVRNLPKFIKSSDNEEFCLALLDKNGKVLASYTADGSEVSYGDKFIYGKIHNEDIDKINDAVQINNSGESQDIVIALLDKNKKVLAYFDGQANCYFSGNVLAPNLGDKKNYDIISLHPYSKTGTMLHNMKRGSYVGGDGSIEIHPPLQLLHFSDIHGDAESLKRIIEFYKTYSEFIDDVVQTGDVMNSTYENDWSFWDAEDAGFIMNVNGNHDRWTGNVVASHVKPWIDFMNGYSQKQGYERYILPYKERWGIVDVPNKMYYYKDYAENNIRLIVLDNYNWKGIELKPLICDDVTAEEKTYHESTTYPDGESIDNGEQLLWFEGVLEDARQNNLNVICVCHAPTSTRTNIECSFQTLIPLGHGGLSAEAIAAVDTFIEQGGHFICWFGGHTHFDVFAKIGTNNQLLINVDSANYARGFGINCKDLNAISRDCFNIINVNTTRGFVTLKRIGVEYDAFGRHLGEITYDYVNKIVLFNK